MRRYPYNPPVAPLHQRYVGLYYWSSYWQSWGKIIGLTHYQWVVQEVDESGNAIGDVRKHCTDLDPTMFADKPFNVRKTK
jgi:hypothetical protein